MRPVSGSGRVEASEATRRDCRGASTPMLVLVLAAILLAMGMVTLRVTTSDIRASGHAKSTAEALYVADAGLVRASSVIRQYSNFDTLLAKVDSTRTPAERLLRIGSDTALRVFADTIAFGSGRFTVKLFDNNDADGNPKDDADNRLFVQAVAFMPTGAAKTVEAVFARQGSVVAQTRGSIVASGTVETKGTLTVDGRDHDMNGNLIGSGTKGISTRKTFTRGGNSKIGGTDNLGFNYAPSKNEKDVEKVTEQNQSFPEPAGPDEALGLTAGTLKAYAQSGANGSQYVTDPSKLNKPFRGVTYVELPCGGSWHPVDFGDATGIVVVNSPCKNAVIKNLNGGTLRGILIVDDIVHVHNTIIGQIIQISGSPSSGNCIGNGNGDILYSSIAISNAISSLTSSVVMIAWREL